MSRNKPNNGITGIKVTLNATLRQPLLLNTISHSEHACVLYISYILLCICAFWLDMMALLMFVIKGKQKHSDQKSPIVALTVIMVCCKPMVNLIADFYFSTNIPHLYIQIGIAAYIFQILRHYDHYHWSLSLTPAFSNPAMWCHVFHSRVFSRLTIILSSQSPNRTRVEAVLAELLFVVYCQSLIHCRPICRYLTNVD